MDQLDLFICQEYEVNPQPVQGRKSKVRIVSSGGHVKSVSLSHV